MMYGPRVLIVSLAAASAGLAVSFGCGTDSAQRSSEAGSASGARTCDARQACEQASDCCTSVSDGYTCNVDYPYLYECVDGYCNKLPCVSDLQCSTEFRETESLTDSIGIGCIDGKCIEEVPCEQPDDCCGGIASWFTCNEDYPFLFDCVDGYCKELPCSDEAQCSQFFSTDADTHSAFGCVDGECLMKQRCQEPDDCCDIRRMPLGYSCNEDYPYLFDCVDGYCETLECSNDAQCDLYAYFAGPTDDVPYVNLGCH